MRKFLFLLAALLLSAVCLATTAFAASNILVFGDSLSAGYGLARQEAWPVLLDKHLKDNGFAYDVVNASVSGETTAGGRSRLADALQQHHPRIVIIELGANDGLRGLPLDAMRDNLEAMIEQSHKAGARIVVIGMRLPPNYGISYTEKFAATFEELAQRHKTALVPFLFEGFATRADAFQADHLHPTAATQPLMMETVWRQLKPILEKQKP